MMEKWRGKYRIPTTRLPYYNYCSNGIYFITICTAGQAHFFGECDNGNMQLSTIGAITQGFWYEIPKHFPFVSLGEFVVMPNHIHGLLILDNPSPVETLHRNVCNASNNSTEKQPLTGRDFFVNISPKSGSVSTIIRSYKSVCSKHIRLAFPECNFGWQARFYDHIVRDEQSHQRIAEYILNNPLSWENDKFYPPAP